MKKIMTIVGERPQFIKTAIVSHSIRQQEKLQEILVHTGKHYDTNMSQIFFDDLEIPKIDYHLGIKANTHGKQTADMITAIEGLLIQEKPDWLLIYGDTNSTLAGALAAAKLHVPIAHVEAGLRSYNRKMPEEINRLVADQLADILFTPTQQAVDNLKMEGYTPSRVIEVGDVMYDAALFYAEKALRTSTILKEMGYKKNEYILATIHRAENTDDQAKLFIIFSALELIAKTLPVILPLHPRTRKALELYYPQLLLHSKLRIIEPVGYLDMIMLEQNARLIITDSGGVQKEAFFYKVPCVTLRDETEWLETVQLNWNRLVKLIDAEFVCHQALQALDTQGSSNQYPYGEGNAAKLIVQHLI